MNINYYQEKQSEYSEREQNARGQSSKKFAEDQEENNFKMSMSKFICCIFPNLLSEEFYSIQRT